MRRGATNGTLLLVLLMLCALVGLGAGWAAFGRVFRPDIDVLCDQIDDAMRAEDGLNGVNPKSPRARSFARRIEQISDRAERIVLADPDDQGELVDWIERIDILAQEARDDPHGGEQWLDNRDAMVERSEKFSAQLAC